MKWWSWLVVMVVGIWSPVRGAVVTDMAVSGRIEGDHAVFTLTLTAEPEHRGEWLPLVEGEVAYLGGTLPRDARLRRDGSEFLVELGRSGRQSVSIEFAGLAQVEGDWRSVTFRIPDATVRKLTMWCDRDDLDVRFPGALSMGREAGDNGDARVTAYLGATDQFAVRWKPEVRRLEGELVVSCDANTIAAASVGALRMDTVYAYRIAQGELRELAFDVPPDVQVTQVAGPDILEWRLEESTPGSRRLAVVLNRPRQGEYRIRILAERVLPAFPAVFPLSMVSPRGVLRTSGFLLAGTESAIRLRVGKAQGLTQVDLDAYPDATDLAQAPRPRPAGAAFAYQYANLPFVLELAADDIVTTLYAEDRLVLSLRNRDLVLDAEVEVDVRDAPAREIVFATDSAWTVARVEGQDVVDTDVRDADGVRRIAAVFGEGVLGRRLLHVRLERALQDDETTFRLPPFRTMDARSERGSLVLSAETGVRLEPVQTESLREVQPGSLPIRVPLAQRAFRFKATPWTLEVTVEATAPVIHAELFHLLSLGDHALFGSCSATYHIEGAPVRELRLWIPEAYQRVDLVGRDIRNWRREGPVWTVVLQEKVIGDYTLLVTHELPFPSDEEEVLAGGIRTEGADSETGYLAVAGVGRFVVEEAGAPDLGMMPIARGEIPAGYRLLLNDPVLRAYKYVQAPHTARLLVRAYPTEPILGKVADHTALETRISRQGELVTTVAYAVKNTSDQYLAVTLPEGAALWSVQVDGRDVQALREGREEALLVPLLRHPDPNLPSAVRLVYAQSAGALGWRSAVRLRAPVCSAQSVFARWEVTAPAAYALTGAGGDMFTEIGRRDTGLGSLAERLWSAARRLGRPGSPWTALAVLAWVGVGWTGLLVGAGARWRWAWAAAGWIVLLAMAALLLQRAESADFVRCLAGPIAAPAAALTQSYTRVVSLADSETELLLGVAPHWVGASGSMGLALAGVCLGSAWAWWRRRVPWERAAAGVVVLWGLCQVLATLQLMYVAAWILVPLWLAAVWLRLTRRWGRDLAGAMRRHRAFPPAVPVGAPAGAEGSASIAALFGLAVVAAAMAGVSAPPDAGHPPPPAQTVLDVNLDVDVPAPEPDRPVIARVRMDIEVQADEAGWMPLFVGGGLVVAGVEPASPEHMTLTSEDGQYGLRIDRRGRYTLGLDLLAPVQAQNGSAGLCLPMPASLRNRARLRLAEADQDVTSPDAVWARTNEGDAGSETELVFRAAPAVALQWKPHVRRTTLEEAVVFGEVHVRAVLDEGVAGFENEVRYQVSRGELHELQLRIPPGLSVTAVRGEGLSTWRFDPDTRLLVALPAQPITGAYRLRVATQCAQEGLPYRVVFGVPEILGADRQRGVLAVAAPEHVQVDLGETEGLYPMNTGDFTRESGLDDVAAGPGGKSSAIKRAFRYHAVPVQVAVDTAMVLPELRVEERMQLDVAEERTVLSSRLEIRIAKAGVYALALDVPEGFDVESLSGEDVSHWDEETDPRRRVVVHFRKQLLGARVLHVVLARAAGEMLPAFAVPRLAVPDAIKHTGELLVSAEPGTRLATARRSGVSEVNPRELGVDADGYLAFRLLRPDWFVELEADLLPPVVKAEVLQIAEISEGMVHGSAWMRFAIEHAGVKSFRIIAPAPDVALHFLGRDIAQVREVDGQPGVWQVDLRAKVERAYVLEARFQQPFDPAAGMVAVRPVRAENAESQAGYVVVRAGTRLQVQPATVGEGLREENARNVPPAFGAGDLSDAILCYRMSRADTVLELAVRRHQAADVLPAVVRRATLASVVSHDGQMITRVEMDLQLGDLRFLEVVLPAGNALWTAFVQDRPVTPLAQDQKILIPVEDVGDDEARIELLYAGRGKTGRWIRPMEFEGPQFNLPLRDVTWTFYLPPGYQYFGFDGSLEPAGGDAVARILRFDARQYDALARAYETASLQRAEESLQRGEQFAREGRQREARQALETAFLSSRAAAAFNEDARIQYRNLARRQAVVGLVHRRDELKQSRNLADDAAHPASQGFRNGNWTVEYGREIESSLDAKDTDSLNQVAERILDQQVAAAGEAPAIRVTLPAHGREIRLQRALQIHPLAEMTVRFRRWPAHAGNALHAALAACAALALFRFAGIPTRLTQNP